MYETLEAYTEAVALMLMAPNAVNENHFVEWCFQKWHGRPQKGGYGIAAIREHAQQYMQAVQDGLRDPASSHFYRRGEPRGDRSRKTSSRIQ